MKFFFVTLILLSFAVDVYAVPSRKVEKLEKGGRLSTIRKRKLQDEDISNDSDNIFSHNKKCGKTKGKGGKTCVPTSSPTSSNAPTSAPFSTFPPTHDPTVSNNVIVTETKDGYVSFCQDTPSSTDVTEEVLVFKYNMYIKPQANVTDCVNSMETLLHFVLKDSFLQCDFESFAAFYVVSIRSDPRDEETGNSCNTSNDPVPSKESECFEVLANLTMSFSSSQETTKQDFLDDIGTYLSSSMSGGDFVFHNIVATSFQGFVDFSSTGRAVGAHTQETTDSNATGSVLGAMAGLSLFIIAVMSVRHRRQKQEVYLKQLETATDENEGSSLGLEDDQWVEPISSKVQLVLTSPGILGDDDKNYLNSKRNRFDPFVFTWTDLRFVLLATFQATALWIFI